MPSSNGGGAASAAPLSDLLALASKANREHEAGVAAEKEALAHYIKAGDALVEAKALVQHGEWLDWLANNFKGSRWTAEKYMKASQHLKKHADVLFADLQSVLAAADADRPSPKKDPPMKPRKPDEPTVKAGSTNTSNQEVIAWVRKLIRAGKTREQIVAASRTGAEGWPGDEAGLSNGGVGTCMRVIEHMERQEAENPPRRPKRSGKRLRDLAQERKKPARPHLTELSYLVVKATRLLETIYPDQYDWSKVTEDEVLSFFEDMLQHQLWLDLWITFTKSKLDDHALLEKIRHLRENTQGRTKAEIDTAYRLADKLEEKRTLRLAAQG